ncbi:MAG TPA: hypothetical protein VIJ43_14085 [Burkholderiales bacterium]
MNAFFPGFERKQIQVRGEALDCGHYLPEERPEEVARQLESFLA